MPTIISGDTGIDKIAPGAIEYADLPTGSVLQVVNVTFSTEVSTSSSTFSDTGLSASITPKFSNSKILVLADIQVAKSTNNTGVDLRVLRDSTNIIQFGKNAGYTGTSAYSIVGSSSCSYLDSPATTSATTYKIQFASNTNLTLARINDNGPTSTLTLMEVAG
jgi:hypothetical protein